MLSVYQNRKKSTVIREKLYNPKSTTYHRQCPLEKQNLPEQTIRRDKVQKKKKKKMAAHRNQILNDLDVRIGRQRSQSKL